MGATVSDTGKIFRAGQYHKSIKSLRLIAVFEPLGCIVQSRDFPHGEKALAATK